MNFEEHRMCENCEMIKTMNHILIECKVNQGPQIWKSAKEICERKHIPWPPNIDISTIMALPLLKVRSNDGRIHQGATCLFLIIMSECTFLIWKLRCKIILKPGHHEGITTIEAINQVMVTINNRLNQDNILTSKIRYKTKALPENLVLCTWSGTLQDEHHLPRKWLTANGVLVGRANSSSGRSGIS